MSRALVIIDIQKDYFPGGRMELVGAEAASDQARKLLSAFRENGEPVFHVQHVFESDDAPFFTPGSEGCRDLSRRHTGGGRAADRQASPQRLPGHAAG